MASLHSKRTGHLAKILMTIRESEVWAEAALSQRCPGSLRHLYVCLKPSGQREACPPECRKAMQMWSKLEKELDAAVASM